MTPTPDPTTAPPDDHRCHRQFERGRSRKKILAVCEHVATVRRVDGRLLFSPRRESEPVASARTFAMAACHAVGVPLVHTALAFRRQWQTIYSAENQCACRYRNSATFRAEWDTLVSTLTKDKA
jgi:hypothetical protein